MRIRATRRPARCGSSIRASRRERSLRFLRMAWASCREVWQESRRRTRRCSTGWSSLGVPVARERAVVEGIGGCSAVLRAVGERRATLPYEIDGVVYRINSRADQQAAWLCFTRAALCDCSQVPGAGSGDATDRHRDPGRPHRSVDAGRAPGAGVRRRRHSHQRHAAQRGRDSPQGRSHRRHRHRPPRRRRDSRNRRGRSRTPAARREGVQDAGALSGVRLARVS